MATSHTAPGDIVSVRPLGRALTDADSDLLLRAEHLEVFRYALPAGRKVQPHAAAGLMVLQCLEGRARFTAMGREQTLQPGDLLYLTDGEPHAVEALCDTSLLVTIVLRRA